MAAFSGLDASIATPASASVHSLHAPMPFDIPSLWTFTQNHQSTSSTPIPHPPFIFRDDAAGTVQLNVGDCIDPQKVMESPRSPHYDWPSGPPWAQHIPLSPNKSTSAIDTTDHVALHEEGGDMSWFVNHDILAPSISQTSSQGSQVPSSTHFPLNLHYDYGLDRRVRSKCAGLSSSWPNDLLSTSGDLANASMDRKDSWTSSSSQPIGNDGLHNEYGGSLVQSHFCGFVNEQTNTRQQTLGAGGPSIPRDRMLDPPSSTYYHPTQVEKPTMASVCMTNTNTSSQPTCVCGANWTHRERHAHQEMPTDAEPAKIDDDADTSNGSSLRRSQKMPKKIYQCKQCIMSKPFRAVHVFMSY